MLFRVIGILLALFTLGTICSFSLNAQAKTTDNSWQLASSCYGPTIHSVLMYLGQAVSLSDLKLQAPIIEDRFAYATRRVACLSIDGIIRAPLPKLSQSKIQNMCRRFPWLSNKSAERIWYYENGDSVPIEAYNFAMEQDSDLVKEVDVIIVMTEAQFEGGGMAVGKVMLVEQPSENGWAKKSNYSNELWSQWYIADVTVHELGHFMGLEHEDPETSPDSLAIACILPEYHENIMSHCRDREAVNAIKGDYFSLGAMVKIFSYFVQKIVKTDP